jgi:hypothetical protein
VQRPQKLAVTGAVEAAEAAAVDFPEEEAVARLSEVVVAGSMAVADMATTAAAAGGADGMAAGFALTVTETVATADNP